MDEYLAEEIEKTGIQNLKIKNNNASGYFFEVTRGQVEKVPAHFMMRRSLTNADRFTTQKLQELERELNSASSNIIETERDLFLAVRESLESSGCTFLSADRSMIPNNTVEVTDEETVAKIRKLVDMLDDYDDTQNVFHNADLPEEEEED